MYQRLAIAASLALKSIPVRSSAQLLSVQAEHQTDDPRNHDVSQKEERRRQRHHDQHHDRGDPDLFPGRPRDLRSLLTHLLNKLQGVLHTQPAILTVTRAGGPTRAVLACAIRRWRAATASASERGSQQLAGAEGLEPPTFGFGDRRSTN